MIYAQSVTPINGPTGSASSGAPNSATLHTVNIPFDGAGAVFRPGICEVEQFGLQGVFPIYNFIQVTEGDFLRMRFVFSNGGLAQLRNVTLTGFIQLNEI